MDIHGITIVRDEADVIEQSLRAATAWCDHIYVLDNGSTDGTWEIVQGLAESHEEIVPYKQWDGPYSESLCGEVFRYFRPDRGNPGDWWCRLDADEFYIDDPRIFLRKVPSVYGNVWSSHFNYYFTDADLQRYEDDPSRYAETSVEDRLRYYRNNWSELRFFRDDGELVWQEGHAWPDAIGRVYPTRIWLKHYQYRSPEQIQRRLDARVALMKNGSHSFNHEMKGNWEAAVVNQDDDPQETDRSLEPSWHDRVVSAEKLDYDARERQFVHRPDLLPDLPPYNHEWMLYSRPGQAMLNIESMDPTPVSSWLIAGASWMRNRL